MEIIVFILFSIGTVYFAAVSGYAWVLTQLSKGLLPIFFIAVGLMFFCGYGAYHFSPFTITLK